MPREAGAVSYLLLCPQGPAQPGFSRACRPFPFPRDLTLHLVLQGLLLPSASPSLPTSPALLPPLPPPPTTLLFAQLLVRALYSTSALPTAKVRGPASLETWAKAGPN